MTVLHDFIDALRAPRITRMTRTPGLLVLSSGSRDEANAGVVEALALVLAVLFVVPVPFVWIGPDLGQPGNVALAVSASLSSAAGALVLGRIGLCGMGRETVIDIDRRELRQHRVTAAGRACTLRCVPLSGIESVHIDRGADGLPPMLMGRVAGGARFVIGTAQPDVLERLHAGIVEAITGVPAPRVLTRAPAARLKKGSGVAA